MRDRLDHAVLLVVGHLGHQAEIEDHELAFGRTQHVAGVWVRVKKAGVEELREVRDHAQVDQLAHVVGLALGELLASHPLRRVHAARGELRVVLRDHYTRDLAHVLGDADAVGALALIVELLVEARCKLVEQIDHVQPLRDRRVAQREPEKPREVQVE